MNNLAAPAKNFPLGTPYVWHGRYLRRQTRSWLTLRWPRRSRNITLTATAAAATFCLVLFLLRISCFSSNTSSTSRSIYLSDIYHPTELVTCVSYEHILQLPNARWRTLTKASALGISQSWSSYPTVVGKRDHSAGQKSFLVTHDCTSLLLRSW